MASLAPSAIDSKSVREAGSTSPPALPLIGVEQRVGIPVAVACTPECRDTLEAVLRALPQRSGGSLILLMEPVPDNLDLLVRELAKRCSLPVRRPADGEVPLADHIYVIPATVDPVLRGGSLYLLPRSPRVAASPFDRLLRSLAADIGRGAIALRLCDNGPPPPGLALFARAGGICIGSETDDLELGDADAAAQLSASLARALGAETALAETPGAPANVPELRRILTLLRARTGSDFTRFEHRAVASAIARRIAITGAASAAEYLNHLHADDREIGRLVDALQAIGAVILGDVAAYRALRDQVLPWLLRGRAAASGPIRVWVSGCGGGEQAYGIAMSIADALACDGKSSGDFRIFATDADDAALERARTGVYPPAAVARLPVEWRERFLRPTEDSRYRVIESLRDRLYFARHNPVTDAPLPRLDLIWAFGLISAYHGSALHHVIEQFRGVLRPGGYLMLDRPSEPQDLGPDFAPVEGQTALYRLTEAASAPRPLPVFPSGRTEAPSARGDGAADLARRLLALAHAPATVLVDYDGAVVYHEGPTSNYLQMPCGSSTRSLAAMLPGSLGRHVGDACRRALDTGREIEIAGAALPRDCGTVVVDVRIRPVRATGSAPVAAISFSEPAVAAGEPASVPTAAARGPLPETGPACADLDLQTVTATSARAAHELAEVRADLAAAEQELKVASRELACARAELRDLRRDLDLARADIVQRTSALDLATTDIEMLLSSTNLAVVFVNRDLQVKLFTAGAAKLICLRPGDVGRPLHELGFIVDDRALRNDCDALLAGGTASEREINTGKRRYRRHLQPYHGHNGYVEGIIISYLPESPDVHWEPALADQHSRMVFEHSPICLIEQDWSDVKPELGVWRRRLIAQPSLAEQPPPALLECRKHVRLTAINEAGRRLLGLSDTAPETEDVLLPSADPRAFGSVLLQFADRRNEATCEDVILTAAGERVPVFCRFAVVRGSEESMARVLVAIVDVRERKALECALRDSEQRLRRALHVVHEGVWDYDVRSGRLWWSEDYARLWGAPPPTATTSYEWLFERVHRDDRARVFALIQAAMSGGDDVWQAEYRCRRADGSYAHVLDRGSISRDEQGRVVRVLGCMLDVTDLKQAQHELWKREQRLHSVLDAAADAIITVNSKARILSVNPAAEQIFARGKSEMLGQPLAGLFNDVDGRLLTDELRSGDSDVFREGSQSLPVEGCRGDDEYFPAEVSVRPVKGAQLFVIIARDLSERRRLEREIIAMSTRQQQEIGREIHDGLGQELTALLMLAAGMERRYKKPDGAPMDEDFAKLATYLKRALNSARNLAKGLAPADIASEGLPAALRDLVANMADATGMPCEFRCSGEMRLDDPTRSTHLYRIAQEALSNAVRYAEATRIKMNLEAVGDRLRLIVSDNGKGLPPLAERGGRLGLHLMSYRANILGGQCRIEPADGGGTRICCEVPLRGSHAPL